MKTFLLIAALTLAFPALANEDGIPEPTQNPKAPYRMFRSQNIYTFLRLDTRTGQVWQVQWGWDNDHRFVVPISLKPLVQDGKTGRFTLYPTFNIHTFILLDQDSGNAWQVQWGEDKERFVVPIE